MSSMDPMRDVFSIRSETMRNLSLRPSRFLQMQNTKSSSLMRQITRPMMYNSSYGRLLRSLLVTVDSSSPAITKTKSLNLSIPVVPSLNLESVENKSNSLPHNFSSDSKKFWDLSTLNTTTKPLVELINKHFPDWRRVLNECQRYSVSGKIDSGILATFSDVSVNELVKDLKNKKFLRSPEVDRF